MDINSEISARIVSVRLENNENQSKFARSLNIPRSTLVGYESGSTIPAYILSKIAQKYNVTESWLLSGERGGLQTQPIDVKTLTKDKHTSKPADAKTLTMESCQSNLSSSDIKTSIEVLIQEATAPRFAEQETRFRAIEERLERLEQSSIIAEEVREPAPRYAPLLEEDATTALPLAENLAAGIPQEACETGDYYQVPTHYIRKGRRYCVARISGTSMVDAGIPDGADVLLEYTDKPVDGAIMVVTHEGHTTLKRLHETKEGWELLYEDGSRAKIELTPGQWEVKGAFVRVL